MPDTIPNDEITIIQVELNKLDDAARKISQKRIELLHQLNALQSRTRALPPETLSLIFQHAISPEDTPTVSFWIPDNKRRVLTPELLGSVSHHWRQVAWTTPKLWTRLSLKVSAGKADNMIALLELYFTNSSNLPVSLDIDFDYTYIPDPESDALIEAVFQEKHTKKIGVFNLNLPPDEWLDHFHHPFPKLVNIKVKSHSWLPKTPPFLINAPVLRQISLDSLRVAVPIQWPTVTVLKLTDSPASTALYCLLNLPNLTEFYYSYLTPDPHFGGDAIDNDEDGLPVVPETFTLHHLERLAWPFKLNEASNAFLHHVRLPALRSLIWDQRQRPFEGEFSSGIWTFFKNLSIAPLTTVHFHGMFNLKIPLIKHIYHENPRIEEIILQECNEESLRVAMSSLISGWDDGDHVDDRQYLAGLKVLQVRDCTAKENYEYVRVLKEYFGDMVAALLKERSSTDPESSLSINLTFHDLMESTTTRIEWRPGLKEELQELVRAGRSIKLLEGGKKVNWL